MSQVWPSLDHRCHLPLQPYLSPVLRLRTGDGWFCSCGREYKLTIGPRYHGLEPMFWELSDLSMPEEE